MGNYLESLGMQIGSQAAGGIMGIALGGLANKQQYNQQVRLQQLQMQGNKEMTDYNMSKQLQMWKDTNYPAQIEQLKKAGLNPAMIYGMSGGGGTTTGQATGQVQSPGAVNNAASIMEIASNNAQLGLLKAQKENIEADTANKRATTTKTGAETKLTEVQTAIASIDEHVKGKTQNTAIATAQRELEKSTEILENLVRQNEINEATKNDQIKQIKAHAIGAVLQNALTQSQTKLTDQAKEKLINDIVTDLMNAYTNQRAVNAEVIMKGIHENEIRGIYKDEWEEIEKILSGVLGGILGSKLLSPSPSRNPIGFKKY